MGNQAIAAIKEEQYLRVPDGRRKTKSPPH
jgi:hypothetical protein